MSTKIEDFLEDDGSITRTTTIVESISAEQYQFEQDSLQQQRDSLDAKIAERIDLKQIQEKVSLNKINKIG